MTIRDRRVWTIAAIALLLLLLVICGYGCGVNEAGGKQTVLVINHPQGVWEADRLRHSGKGCSHVYTEEGLNSWACPGYTIREVEVRP